MDRTKSTLTSDQYARAIIALSKRYSSISVFPGNNYVDLGEWMKTERNIPSPATKGGSSFYAPKPQQPHDLVVLYSISERKWELQQYGPEQHESFSTASLSPGDNSIQLLFMRGFLSPSWVSAIGSKYHVDPEFFRRHMDFLSISTDRHAFSSPSLASSCNSIFRLCVNTILYRDDFGRQNVHIQRQEQSRDLNTYKIQQLRSTKVSCGDSIGREYSTLCSSFSVLEQYISICVTRHDKGWLVMAWMDQGRPLEKSPLGPWKSHLKSKATTLPVLQSHPKMGFRTTTNRLDVTANETAEIQQSATLLPSQYESIIALVDLARRTPQDPLSMCIPLFAHAAFSELQFLNLMDSRIQIQIQAVTKSNQADALGTFQYFSSILNRHVQQLKDSRRALYRLAERTGQTLHGRTAESPDPTPRNASPPILGAGARRNLSEPDLSRSFVFQGSEGAFTPKGLMEDYEQLEIRCAELSGMCTWGINLAMNKATIDESRKGIEQSGRLKKLTVLATFFIPLSFCSSLFGMNVDVLTHGTVKLWWFFVICVPVTLLAYVVYVWDMEAMRVMYKGLMRKFRNGTEKDVGHMV